MLQATPIHFASQYTCSSRSSATASTETRSPCAALAIAPGTSRRLVVNPELIVWFQNDLRIAAYREIVSMHAMGLSEFKDFADLVANAARCIDSTWLPADGRLQMHGVGLDRACEHVGKQLAKGFRGLSEDDFPMHYCAWGKARVGSTALSNLFGLAGFPSYYQPVKAMLRTAFAGQLPAPWILPFANEHPSMFTKETQGPYTLGECLFIPIQVLIEAGYPPSRLHLIVLERDPERSLASWLSKLTMLQPAEILLRHYVISALNVNRVRRYAKHQGVPVTHFVYEASKEPVVAARALFNRLGLARIFSDTVVTSWGERGQLDSSTSHQIIYPPQPVIYDLPGLHGSDSGYRYRNGGTSINNEQRDLLEWTGVTKVYQDAVEACIIDLGLDAETAARLFGPRLFGPKLFGPKLSAGAGQPDFLSQSRTLSAANMIG